MVSRQTDSMRRRSYEARNRSTRRQRRRYCGLLNAGLLRVNSVMQLSTIESAWCASPTPLAAFEKDKFVHHSHGRRYTYRVSRGRATNCKRALGL